MKLRVVGAVSPTTHLASPHPFPLARFQTMRSALADDVFSTFSILLGDDGEERTVAASDGTIGWQVELWEYRIGFTRETVSEAKVHPGTVMNDRFPVKN